MAENETPVWLITGCSTGFGRELARLVLERGWRVAVTVRDAGKVADLVEGRKDRALALALDVDDRAQVEAAVRAAEARFGRNALRRGFDGWEATTLGADYPEHRGA